MIAEISKGKDLEKAIGYNQSKVEKNKAEVLFVNLFRYRREHNLQANVAEMRLLIPGNHRTKEKNLGFHVSINPHPDDPENPEQMKEIAKYYMRRMGYEKQPYIVYVHRDIERVHYHIVSIRVDEKGRKINDHNERIRSTKITGGIERKFGLTPKDEKVNQSERQSNILTRISPTEGNLRKKTHQAVLAVMDRYHFSTLGEYNAVLSNYGMEAIRVDEPKRGFVYRVLDAEGEAARVPIPSAQLGKGTGEYAFNRKVEKSKPALASHRAEMRNKLMPVLKRASKDKASFLREMEENGIQAIFRENASGRVYGVTFIEEDKGLVYNGSSLGKAFSANHFERFFQEPEYRPWEQFPETVIPPAQKAAQHTALPAPEEEEELFTGGIHLTSSPDDYEWKEQRWQQKLRREEQRRNRGRRY